MARKIAPGADNGIYTELREALTKRTTSFVGGGDDAGAGEAASHCHIRLQHITHEKNCLAFIFCNMKVIVQICKHVINH